MSAHSEIRTKSKTLSAGGPKQSLWVSLRTAVAKLLRSVGRWLVRADSAPARLGAYTLDRKIGEGGMGVVYKAVHSLLGRPAAIKLLAPERSGDADVERFEREVRLTSQLTHPNTIAVYDFGTTEDGAFYYAMEYVDGLDLQTLVERYGPQDPARVAHLLAQLAGALAEAHGAGLVHRDIKPANLMVCERGGVPDVLKLLDFGLVDRVANDESSSRSSSLVVGTPLYLSPEAILTPEKLDARSDLYAVGAVGYFLLTGIPPFSGRNVLEVCARHLTEAPRPPSEFCAGITPELETLVLACLAKSSAERPESATALRTALLGVAANWTEGRGASFWSQLRRDDQRAAA